MNLSSLHALTLLVVAQLAPVETERRAPAPPPPAQVKRDFLKLLDRPRVPLDVKVEETQRGDDGLVTERLSFATETKADGTTERVPTLVIRTDSPAGRRPAVIVLHGTGGSKDGMKSWLTDLARRGYIGVAIDARYHGARAGGAKGSAAYVAAISRVWKAEPGSSQEHPFYYDTCWDLWRTLDYLAMRDDVDPKRIGMLGTSMGGIETWLAASVDDRVAVAVPAIAVQSFRWSLENGQWRGRARTIAAAHDAAARDLGEPEVNERVCRTLWNKVIPGMLGPFDCPSMIRLFAPRPLLTLNGDKDPNCPIGGARLAFAAARAAYEDADASDRLEINVARDTGHTVTAGQKKAALAWFERWLKP